MSQLTLEDIRRDCCQEYYVQCGGATEPHGVINVRAPSGDGLAADWFPTPAWCPLCCWYIDADGNQQPVIYYLYFLDNSGNQVSFGGVEYMQATCDGQGNWNFLKPGYNDDGCILIGSSRFGTSFNFQMSVAGGFGSGSGDTGFGALIFEGFQTFYSWWWGFWGGACDWWWWGTATELHAWRITDYKCNDTDGFSCTWRIPDGGLTYGNIIEDGSKFIAEGVHGFRVEAAAPTIGTKCHSVRVNGCGNFAPLPGAVYDVYNQHWNGTAYEYALVAEGTTDIGGIVQWDNSIGYGWGPIGTGAYPNRLYRTINIPFGTAGYNRFKPQLIGVGTQYPYTGQYQQVIEYINTPADGFVCNYISYYQATPYPLWKYMNWTILDVPNQRVIWSSDDFGQLYSPYGYNWTVEFDYLFEGCPGTGCPNPQTVHVIITMSPNQFPYTAVYIQFQYTSPYNFCPDPSYTGYAYLIFQSISVATGLPFLMSGITADYRPYGGVGMFCSNGPFLFTATEAI